MSTSDPLAPSSNEGGPDHLNSWRWSHVDRLIGWRHRGGIPYPLTPQARGQDQLHGNQRGSSNIDGKRGVGWERPWRRLERLHQAHYFAWAIHSHIRHRLRLPAQPGKNGNRPSMESARGGESPPLGEQG